MRLDNVRDFPHRITHNAQSSQVYRSRSPTNHVTFQVDDAQRKIMRHRRRLERKLVQQIKLGEGRLTGLEARIQLYEDRFREIEDEYDLMKKYKELSDAQNHFIEAQKTRISELEKQGGAHTGELSRTCQLNRDLSATIHCQNVTICDLEKRLAEGASNYAAIATLFQDHSLHESLSVDSKGLNYATQDDIFTEFFASNHNISCTTEVADSATSRTFTMADDLSPTLSQWQTKESASPNSQMTAWQKTEILKEDGFSC
jgi:hypothetical protein